MTTGRRAPFAERNPPRDLALVEVDGNEIRVGWLDERNRTELRPGLLRGPAGPSVGSREDAVRRAEFAVVRIIDVHVGIGPIVLANLIHRVAFGGSHVEHPGLGIESTAGPIAAATYRRSLDRS